jgi:hypothetical protein
MIISSQQRFLLSLVVLSLLWLLMVTVQLSRVERIYHSNPSAPSAASIGGAPAVEDDALPEWAELMLPSESERKQFQRYAAARRAEERDVLNRMREIRNESSRTTTQHQR